MRTTRPPNGARGTAVLRTLTRGGLAVVAGLATVALSGCAWGAPQRAPLVHQSEPWKFGSSPGYKLTTEHYEIYTTMQDQVLLDTLPGFIEAAFAHYQACVPSARTPEQRMKIYLFVRRAEWEYFTRRWTGPRAKIFLHIRNGGYVERGVAAIEYVAHQITFPLFAHEGLHQYLHHYVQPGIPAWLNEGLAVGCEGQRWGMKGIKEFDPWYNPKRRNDLAQAVQSGRLYPLRELLEMNPGYVIEGSSKSIAGYYAQVWALVLFLQDGADGKYADGFRRLLDSLAEQDLRQYARAAHIWSDRDTFNLGEALFRGFISEDLETVEREYVAFMRERFLGS